VRGGGGNFGIVTAFEYQLHRVGPVLADFVIHPLEKAKDLLTFYREFTRAAQRLIDAFYPPGLQQYWRSSFLQEISDAAIATMVASCAHRPSPMCHAVIEHTLGGSAAPWIRCMSMAGRNSIVSLPPRKWPCPRSTLSRWLRCQKAIPITCWRRPTAAWGRETFADLSTIPRVLDAFALRAVAQRQTASARIDRREGQALHHPVTTASINRELACLKRTFNVAREGLIVLRGGVAAETPVVTVSLERENNTRDRVLSKGESCP
jgi:hypothetical protein